LKLKYDEPLSNFAYNFNLRRYTTVGRIEMWLPAAPDPDISTQGPDNDPPAAAAAAAGSEGAGEAEDDDDAVDV